MSFVITEAKAPEIQEKIESYFNTSENKPTVSGLLRHLGFKSFHNFHDNVNRSDIIGDILSDAYMRLIDYHEKRLYEGNCSGSVVFLKSIRLLGFNFTEVKEIQDLPEHRLDINIIVKEPNVLTGSTVTDAG